MLKQIQHVRVKYLLAIIACVWLCCQWALYLYIDEYTFTKIPQKSVRHQKSCLSEFLDVFKKHRVALILFDIEILPEMFQSKPESWHSIGHDCKTMCKYHPENKNLISFAIQAYQFNKHKDSIRADLKVRGFAIHMTTARDPVVFQSEGRTQFIPTYLWLAKKDHVIHVAILYERHNNYVWIGPVTDKNWKNTVNVLAHELTDGWHKMEVIGTKFPTYEQAFDKTSRFMSFILNVDGHKVSVPYYTMEFVKEFRQSRFVDCDYSKARRFKLDFPIVAVEPHKKFRLRVKDSLLKVKEALDKYHVQFWLSGGTLLGWHRECDVIPYSRHIVLGMWANSMNPKVMKQLAKAEVVLQHHLGNENDSNQLSFMSTKERIAVEIFSFYVEGSSVWYGGTQEHNGRKYKFSFDSFDLCWTEYLELKVRVPCQADMYVEASMGKDWMVPREEWIWNLDPPNVQTNGMWEDFMVDKPEPPAIVVDKKKLKGEEEVDDMIAEALDTSQHENKDVRKHAEFENSDIPLSEHKESDKKSGINESSPKQDKNVKKEEKVDEKDNSELQPEPQDISKGSTNDLDKSVDSMLEDALNDPESHI